METIKSWRQIHMDFHTSQYIPDVGRDFDAAEFADRLERSFVNSVTIFAKCHHGMSYYPTKVGVQHPALQGRDMLGEMLEALHRKGIRAPIYTTIGWEEDVARRFPQWRQLKKDGTFAQIENSSDGIRLQPGGWKFNNWFHPEYQDYIEAHLLELLTGYEVDGLFLDIVFFHKQAGWSEKSFEFRKKHELTGDSARNQVLFEAMAQETFAQRFTKLISSKKPDATIFYNTPNNLYVIGGEGSYRKAQFQTHFEIESLPSGFWGYFHFPRLARRLSERGKFWLGMTGKFQRMWGDFGGLKPRAALEYECFRSQALGGGNSVGDQLHPRGTLDEASYELIGSVYRQVAEAEPFYRGSSALRRIGVLCPNYPGVDEDTTAKSEEGAVLILDELHYECAVLDDDADLSAFDLIVLPDTVVITEKLKVKISEYLSQKGRLLISYRSGSDESGRWNLDLPFTPVRETDLFPTFWRVTGSIEKCGLPGGERVIYNPGMEIEGVENTEVLVDRILPYFKRTDVMFCSHFQTPPDRIDAAHPAVVRSGDVVYCADPVFREYREVGSYFIRDVLRELIRSLIGPPPFGDGLPSSILSVPRRRGADLILTLLHYVPVRKALEIDIIEQRMSFAGEILKMPLKVDRIFCVNTGQELDRIKTGEFLLPALKGRLLLEVKDYFSADRGK